MLLYQLFPINLEETSLLSVPMESHSHNTAELFCCRAEDREWSSNVQ